MPYGQNVPSCDPLNALITDIEVAFQKKKKKKKQRESRPI